MAERIANPNAIEKARREQENREWLDKRQKVIGEEVTLNVCENCLQQALLPDGTCLQCGAVKSVGNGHAV